jgi:hypothetical protein
MAMPARAADSPSPAAIEKISERWLADTAGIMVYRSVLIYEQHAPGNNEHDEQDVTYAAQDRRVIAARVHRVVDKGRTQTAGELIKTQAQTDKEVAALPEHPRTRFNFPFAPESIPEYTYGAPVRCGDCAGGASITFTNSTKDERHGTGTIFYDPATWHLAKVEFIPNVLPKFTNEAKMTYTYGRHEDGSWGLLKTQEHYLGRMMMISGGVERTITISEAKHYTTADEARHALQ